MTKEEILRVAADENQTEEEKTRCLRQARAVLLDEIHEKQQLLDRVDYLIYEMRSKRRH